MKVRRHVLAALVAHALDDRPNECCGLLLGDDAVVDEAVRARNERASPTRFLIHVEDHIKALRLARSSGRRVIGAYHSHPRGPSRPSDTDRAEMNDPGLVHVIVSLADGPPDVRAYEWREGTFEAVELTAID